MTTTARTVRRSLPARASILREQFAFISDCFMRYLPLLIPALLPFPILVGIATVEGGRVPGIVAVVFLACLMAPLSWPIHKSASEQAYFRSLTLAFFENASIRTVAGWIFVAGGGAVLLGTLQMAGWRSGVPLWAWLTPFAGALVIFLGFSGALLGSRRPMIWLQVIAWSPLVFVKFGDWIFGGGSPFPLNGRFGLFTLATGRVGAAAFGSDAVTGFELPSWLIATSLWLALSGAVFVYAATRHRDL